MFIVSYSFAGDHHLGGEDINKRLLEEYIPKIKEISGKDITLKTPVMQQHYSNLIDRFCAVKEHFSTNEEV